MAFVRSWAEGLDVAVAWHRYMGAEGQADARRARGELQRLLDALRAQARAQGRPELAALLRRDPEAMVDKVSAAPSLDEFRDQQPADFYSEAELAELYETQFGGVDSRSAARRRQRLRERLAQALSWLESRAAKPPQPDDAVRAWLDERIAARLAQVGILKLGELMYWVRVHGFAWHRRVPRLGPRGAARVVAWLGQHANSLGALPASALLPRRQWLAKVPPPAPATGIVPLERFVPPAALDGRQGSNRGNASQCKLPAQTDQQALMAWLALRDPASHTWRAYRKEAERFWLWAVVARNKALSSLDGSDCAAYLVFMQKPGLEWTGPRHAQRCSEAWRPFEGPLSQRSAATAITIVKGLCDWLVRQAYLVRNPWQDALPLPVARPAGQAGVSAVNQAEAKPPTLPGQTLPLRAFTQTQWHRVEAWLASVPPSPALTRLECLLQLAYGTGMRLSELAQVRVQDLQWDDNAETPQSLQVRGKRGQWRSVALPSPASQAVQVYLQQRGLGGAATAKTNSPLLAHLHLDRPLSAGRIHAIFHSAFEACALSVHSQDPAAAQRIRRASAHWLRHTHGVHAAAAGVAPAVLQANLGHRNLAATTVYLGVAC
jgi:site-specific recombinase XerD